MKTYFKIALVVGLLAWLPINATAQFNLTLYQMHHTVPQANMVNPAFFPSYRVSAAFPGLGSAAFNYNSNSLRYKDVVSREDGRAFIDFENVAGNLRDVNRLNLQTDNNLFFLGIRNARSYMSLSVNVRSNSNFTFPDELGTLALLGNTSVLNNEIDFEQLSGNGVVYNEYALGYGRRFGTKLTLGLRAKVLVGVGAGSAEDLSGSFFSDIDEVRLRIDNFEVTYIDPEALGIEDDPSKAAWNDNLGFAIDAGANYQFNERLSFNAAINDLGFINWNEGVTTLRFQNIDYTFNGVDFLDFIDGGDAASITDDLDSLANRLENYEEIEGGSFRTALNGRVYGGANYELTPSHHVGALLYSNIYQGRIYPALSLYYNLRLGRVFNAVVSPSLINGQVNNVGFGFSLNLGWLQFYTVTDNIMAAINPESTRNLDLRAGINLTFGRTGAKQRRIKTSSDAVVLPGSAEEAGQEGEQEEQ